MASRYLNKQLKLIRVNDANGATWGSSIAGRRASVKAKIRRLKKGNRCDLSQIYKVPLGMWSKL